MTFASKPFVSFLACLLILPTMLATMYIHGFDTKETEITGLALHRYSADSVTPIPVLPVYQSDAPSLTAANIMTAAVIGNDALSAATNPAAVTADDVPALDPETVIATEPVVETIDPTNDHGMISDIRSSLISADNRPCLWVGQEIASFALQYDGFKYKYGSASPSTGFDCSGFAYYIYGQFGYTLPRTAHLQYKEGTVVPRDQLRPGDLVFFTTDGSGSVSHVGIYIGNDQFINATTTGKGVMICGFDNNYWSKAYIGAKRIVTDASAVMVDAAALQNIA